MVCTENMFREHVPAGTVPRTSVNARKIYKLSYALPYAQSYALIHVSVLLQGHGSIKNE